MAHDPQIGDNVLDSLEGGSFSIVAMSNLRGMQVQAALQNLGVQATLEGPQPALAGEFHASSIPEQITRTPALQPAGPAVVQDMVLKR